MTQPSWRRELLVDREGLPLDVVPRPELHQIPFTLKEPERSLQTLRALGQVLESGMPQQASVAKSLLAICQSSPAALEGALRRFVTRSDKRASVDDLIGVTEDESTEDMLNGQADPATAERARALAEQALLEVEALQGDSKPRFLAQRRAGWGPFTPFSRTCAHRLPGHALLPSAEIEGRG
jgi:hypothetical protein